MWEIFRNKRIFATGCTGFVGSWLIYSFLYANQKYSLNAHLTLLTRNPEKFWNNFSDIKNNSNIQIHSGDIETFTIPDGDCDFVIHGATEVASLHNDSDHSEILDVALRGTKRIITFCNLKKVQKVLFLSSGAAYGEQLKDTEFIDEQFKTNLTSSDKRSVYGLSKKLSEEMLFHEINPFVTKVYSARIFACAGPFLPLNSEFAFSHFLKSCLENKDIKINGNGKTIRSYIYGADLALILWKILLNGENKEIYNIGSDQEISISQLAEKIKQTLKSSVNIEVLGEGDEFSRYIPSIKKIEQNFDFKPLTNLEQIILKSYDFYKGQYAI